MYNILYGALAGDAGAGRYGKHFTRATLTSRGAELAALLRCDASMPPDKRRLYASAVCACVLDTQFGNEIAALDINNTYVHPVREDNTCLYDTTTGPDTMGDIVSMLDDDIRERLAAPQWIDIMAAGCLQLLREVL